MKQKDLFLAMWESDTPKECVLCFCYLPPPARSFYFSHVLGKGAFPRIKLLAENIVYKCFDCHQKYDQGDPSGLPGYKELIKKREDLKYRYHTNQI